MRWPWQKSRAGGAPKRPVRVREGNDDAAARPIRLVRGRYDAAQTTADNRRHWLAADILSADAAGSPDVRRVLRTRTRYEVANNSYARGIVKTLADDLVGRGPRLQMLTKDAGINLAIEREFTRWSAAIRLPQKLRTMRKSRAQDGEAFALLTNNPGLPTKVQLDLKLVEADQISTPDLFLPSATAVDGIVFDEFGNPKEYHILKAHPGDQWAGLASLDYDHVPASYVLHWFSADRPGQSRGLPDLMPALPLFAQLRRYTLAVLTAAESAADIAVVMGTDAPAGGDAAEVEPMAVMETEKGMMVFSPEGWKPYQMTPEQPSTTYPQFKRETISEQGRCVGMPYNVAACDSSQHNYAAGQLDQQRYRKSTDIEQGDAEVVILDPTLIAFLAEARLIEGLLPPGVLDENDPHQWLWPVGQDETDPRWSNAEIERVQAGLETEARYQSARGRDWEEEVEQRRREAEARAKAGLPQPWDKPEAAPAAPTQNGNQDADEPTPGRTAAHFAGPGRGGR